MIKVALFDMNPWKVLGPNGFLLNFIKVIGMSLVLIYVDK